LPDARKTSSAKKAGDERRSIASMSSMSSLEPSQSKNHWIEDLKSVSMGNLLSGNIMADRRLFVVRQSRGQEPESFVGLVRRLGFECSDFLVPDAVLDGSLLASIENDPPDAAFVELATGAPGCFLEIAEKLITSAGIPGVFISLDPSADRGPLKPREQWPHLRQPCSESETLEAIELTLHLSDSEKARELLKAQLCCVLESVADAVLLVNDRREILLMNGLAESLTGAADFQPGNTMLEEVVHLLNSETGDGEEVPLPLEQSKPQEVSNAILVSRDGTKRPVDLHLTPVVNTWGAGSGAVLILRDLGEQKQLEQSLSKLSGAFEQIADNVLICNRNGVIEYVNPAFEAATGYSRTEVIGKTPRILKSGQHGKHFYERLWKDLLAGKVFRAVFVNQKKSGDLFYEEQTLTPLKDTDGNITHFIAAGRDITERRRLEDQLRMGQKMEAVAQLAGGIAHDFNNILTIITGYGESLEAAVGDDQGLKRRLGTMMEAAERARDLTRQLLAFSRKQVLDPKVVRLNAIVSDVDRLLCRVLGEDIELSVVLQSDLGTVLVDPGQIEEAIITLAANARDSMPQGGKLIIETSDVELDELYARSHPSVKPGKYVMLAVSDTGQGMDVETRQRIFEPFFSTAARGTGTGLGLATVYGIVKQSGGYIYAYSEAGHGTTFKIYFPRVGDQAEALTETQPAREENLSAETILVVEDEEGIRELLKELLEMEGYTVFCAGLGSEAVDLAGNHDGPVHLLLTDVVMPGMSGRELAERLTAQRPDMKVLYMSGYTANVIVHHGLSGAETAFLQKPFTPGTLLAKVREVIGLRKV
jgi:two-component system, cell cycle sensor histidine kinase and response regulator CckA